jgi:O-acetylhomoserine (thiol)-lyase
MSPFNAWMFLQGLETLHLRMQRTLGKRLAVARFLETHDCVSWVRYPGLASSPTYAWSTGTCPRARARWWDSASRAAGIGR